MQLVFEDVIVRPAVHSDAFWRAIVITTYYSYKAMLCGTNCDTNCYYTAVIALTNITATHTWPSSWLYT